jgi:ABC-2 type transport system permease protein
VTAATAVAAPASGELTGTGRLVRFALRRDRVRLPAWVLGITLSLIVTTTSFPGLYQDQAARQARAALMGSPAAVAMGGPRIGVDDYTFGAMLTNEMLGFVAVVVALMSIFTVVRHTRADEEAGRTELVLAGPVGRHAPLAAGLTVMALANVAIAVLSAAGLAALGIESIDLAGSLLFGAALGAVGLVFGAVAGVTAQVSEHSRTASGIAGAALGAAYALRAVGDVTQTWVSWLSPVGWAQRTYAYVDNSWWPVLLSLAVAGALVAGAVSLSGRRDLGAGLRQPRPGPASASPGLGSPLGLAVRLHRTALVVWICSFLGFGLLYGTLFGEVEGFAAELDVIVERLEQFSDDLIQAFLSILVLLFSMTASIFAILAVLRAQSEESAGRGELVLATPAGRVRWLSGFVVVALVGGWATLLAGALGVGISGALSTGDAGVLASMLTASLVQLAPLALVVGLAVALYGWLPRATAVVWAVVGFGMVGSVLGTLLGLPAWMLDLSPYAMVPQAPAQEVTAGPIVAMAGAAIGLVALGLVGFRRRDLRTS